MNGRKLTPEETSRLAKLVDRAKPSVITRTLVGWRFLIPDPKVRLLSSKGIFEARWK